MNVPPRRRDFLGTVLVGGPLALVAGVALTSCGTPATLGVWPTGGLSGSLLRVRGEGFSPRARGGVRAGGATVPVVADASGTFEAAVHAAGDPAQEVAVVADLRGAGARSSFTVTSWPWPSGNAVGLGTTSSPERPASPLVPRPDLVLAFAALADPWSPAVLAQRAGPPGATLLLTIEPWDPAAGSTDQPSYRLARVVDGTWDDELRTWARTVAGAQDPVMVRFAHEMNGDWYPWSEQANGNRPGEYAAAWRHVVDLFRREGATEALWVWSPNVVAGLPAPLGGLWPGAPYVDVVGLDGYNWGAGSSSPAGPSWISPADLFDPTLDQVRRLAPGLPVMVCETACAEAGGDKARWITSLVDWARGRPELQALVWFDLDKEEDWRLDSSRASARAALAALPLLARRHEN